MLDYSIHQEHYRKAHHTSPYHITLNCIASHHTIANHIALHHITPYLITSHHTSLHLIIPLYITPPHNTLPHHIILHYSASFNAPHHITSPHTSPNANTTPHYDTPHYVTPPQGSTAMTLTCPDYFSGRSASSKDPISWPSKTTTQRSALFPKYEGRCIQNMTSSVHDITGARVAHHSIAASIVFLYSNRY